MEDLFLGASALLERLVVVQVGTETTQILNTGHLERRGGDSEIFKSLGASQLVIEHHLF